MNSIVNQGTKGYFDRDDDGLAVCCVESGENCFKSVYGTEGKV